MKNSPVSILYNRTGQLLDVVNDGGVYRLVVQAVGHDPVGMPLTANPIVFAGLNGANIDVVNISDIGGQKAIKVDVIQTVGGVGGGGGATFGSAFPATGSAIGFSDGAVMSSARVFDIDTGGGTQNVLGVSLRKAASGGSVEFGTITDPFRIDPTGATTQPVSIAAPIAVGIIEGAAGSAKKVLYDIGTTAIYIGTAVQGTAPSAAAWLIKRTTLDIDGNPTDTLWSATTAVWNNRVSESYS